MSIQVSNVSKLYGTQKALNQVSFSIKPGEIVGFLGPNGAGKSTMMKILTCYIPQTDGEASVCGFDTRDNSIEVRKKVGYLPEHNPLYLEMYVREYLEFVANIYKLSNKKQRIAEVIDLVELGPEKHKKIEELSKGYRQRVGLAQAIIHNPEVLILDEPTSGLDVNQIDGVRKLIKDIGKEKTVMLSTHIMQEVEAICSRAILIRKGEIVADDTIVNIGKSASSEIVVHVEFSIAVNKNQLLKIEGVREAVNPLGNIWLLKTHAKKDARPHIFSWAVANKVTVLALKEEEKSLEDAFKVLTK
ncbi:MAG: gliding motility-associated ABC transporter ATP-binding subunit GldA [Luteibaculaceae bacterium]